MRILVVTPSYLPIVGGAETGIYEIYNRIAVNHQVRIMTPHIPAKDVGLQGFEDQFYLRDLIEVHRFYDFITFGKTGLKQLWQKIIPPVSLSYLPAVRKEIRTFKPDIINIHYLFPSALALRAIRKYTDIPVLLSLVSRTDVLHQENLLFQWHPTFIQNTLKAASAATALTSYMLNDSPAARQIKIIPYGADINRFSPSVGGEIVRNRYGIGQSRILFTLQRLQRVKRIDFLIESLKHLVAADRDVVLVIGGKGPEEHYLRALVDELQLSDRVIFAGFISEAELPAYFAAADLFVFSSASETFGIVLAQALSSGTPIAALDSTCVAEVVTDEQNGKIVKTEDPALFARTIGDLFDNDDRYRTLCENARVTAVEVYNWDIISRKYENLLEELI
jgi:glycosyltransferase involved in cell wall biosynthesis